LTPDAPDAGISTARLFSAGIPGDTLPAADSSMQQLLRFDHPSPLSCLLAWLPGAAVYDETELKSYIRSTLFRRFRRSFGDRKAVDAIYVRAMTLTNNNTALALLLSAFACFDQQDVGIRNPVFNLVFPLADESYEDFSARVKNLPSRLYADTPHEGDRDKLQHFFGSAFLTYISESRASADRIGEFIEEGENAFIIGGVEDNRDRRANRQGQLFATALFDNNLQYPSAFLVPELPDNRSGNSFH
jgi:hypothetical protein